MVACQLCVPLAHSREDQKVQYIDMRHLWTLWYPLPTFSHTIFFHPSLKCSVLMRTAIITLDDGCVTLKFSTLLHQIIHRLKHQPLKKGEGANLGSSAVPHEDPVTLQSTRYKSPFRRNTSPSYINFPSSFLRDARCILPATL